MAYSYSYGCRSRLYRAWYNMIYRATSDNYIEVHRYKKRGISVCDEWLYSYDSFKEWALQNGYSDNLTLDRINNDKGYSPDNCRWVDQKTQCRNRSSNVFIEYKGEKKILIEWVELLGLNYKLIQKRLERGWTTEEAFERPLRNS